jgi:hypothetical protein
VDRHLAVEHEKQLDTNSPWSFTSRTCWPFSSPTTLGLQCSVIRASFSARFTFNG